MKEPVSRQVTCARILSRFNGLLKLLQIKQENKVTVRMFVYGFYKVFEVEKKVCY